jgi:hypothetical protein
MQKRNYYKTITESIVKAHHYTNLDSAMEDGYEMDNMGKKIVAIITADPDQDLDWESEYEPFGATELSDEDEKECCEHEGIESDHELCPSCGYDVDCEDDDCEDDENDDMEDIMIGGGFESSNDEFENADIKDILVDILHELRGDEEESDDEEIEISDENPMFGDSDDEESDDESDDEDEDEDVDSMLAAQNDWSSEESDDEGDDDEESDDEEKEEEEEEEGDMDEILSIKEVENC